MKRAYVQRHPLHMRAGQDMCVGVDVDVNVDVDKDWDWDWGQVARVVGWWWAYASVAGLVATSTASTAANASNAHRIEAQR